MYSFNYQKAKSIDDAAKVIAKNAEAKLLAGGQSLIAAMKLRLAKPSDLVDLGTRGDPRERPAAADAKADGSDLAAASHLVFRGERYRSLSAVARGTAARAYPPGRWV